MDETEFGTKVAPRLQEEVLLAIQELEKKFPQIKGILLLGLYDSQDGFLIPFALHNLNKAGLCPHCIASDFAQKFDTGELMDSTAEFTGALH